jgi:hypothetical protein
MDPDAMLRACDDYAATISSGVGGNRVVAVCQSWATLQDIKNVASDTDMAVFDIDKIVLEGLSDEYANLSYQRGTISGILAANKYALPVMQQIVETQMDKATTAQTILSDLSCSKIAKLTSTTMKQYIVSKTIAEIITPISQGLLPLQTVCQLDETFNNPGTFSVQHNQAWTEGWISVGRYQSKDNHNLQMLMFFYNDNSLMAVINVESGAQYQGTPIITVDQEIAPNPKSTAVYAPSTTTYMTVELMGLS